MKLNIFVRGDHCDYLPWAPKKLATPQVVAKFCEIPSVLVKNRIRYNTVIHKCHGWYGMVNVLAFT